MPHKYKKVINDKIAKMAINNPDFNLSSYDEILDSSAQLLAKSNVFHLSVLQMNGIVGLLDGPAMLLNKKDVDAIYTTNALDFSGMSYISPTSIKYLLKQKRGKWTCIYLNGIKTLDCKLASSFSEHEGIIFLDGLTHLTGNTAKLLSMHAGYMSLNGIKELTVESAEWLGKYKGRWLSLDGLEELTKPCAEKLMLYDRKKIRPGRDIFDNPPKLYNMFTGHIKLNGLVKICDGVAQSLSRNFAGLELNGLKMLTIQQAVYLAMHKGGIIYLNGLNEISPELAKALSNHSGALHLNGIKELSESVAEHLGNYKGTELSLNGLKKIKQSSAELLAYYKGWDLSLTGLKNLDKKTIEILNKTNAYRLFFEGSSKLRIQN